MAKNTILLNMNRFGPIYSQKEKELLLTKPKKNSLKNHQLQYVKMLEDFLSKNFTKIEIEEIKRYCEITDKETHLSITPSYEQLINRIIQPIVLGKKYFTLGEYVPCIAMSGLAAEMMTLVFWGMSAFSIGGKAINEKDQEILFGKMNQKRRIEILYLTKGINKEGRDMLESIRNIRNKYTHSWDIKKILDKGNAKKVIRYALILFKDISGIDLYIDDNGKQQLKVNPKFLEFIKSKTTLRKK